MATLEINEEREIFEKRMAELYGYGRYMFERTGSGLYSSNIIGGAWEAWRAARPPIAQPVAWMTEDGRVATDETKRHSMSASSHEAFNIPLFKGV